MPSRREDKSERVPCLGEHLAFPKLLYAAMGRALYALVRLALMRVLPVLRDVKRARLAIQGQPSPSKPVIPECVHSIAQHGRGVYRKKVRRGQVAGGGWWGVGRAFAQYPRRERRAGRRAG